MEQKQRGFVFSFFLCALIAAGVFFAFWRFDVLMSGIKAFFLVLRPLFVGGFIALIINGLFVRLTKIFEKPIRSEKVRRGVCVALTYTVFLGAIALIILFVIPKLVESLSFFADNFDAYYAEFTKFLAEKKVQLDGITFLKNADIDLLDSIYKYLYGLSEKVPEMISTTFGITTNIIKGIVDLFVGIVFSAYILFDKKVLLERCKRLTRALFSSKTSERMFSFASLSYTTLSKFIGGQLTEALILTLLCFIGMTIFGFDYAFMISILIGVTSLIPVFGAFMGTIPAALILLLIEPMQAVWFVVFIIILQQLETNLIYPRVVGNSVGLPPMFTLAAVIIGGGFFNVWGMLLGVPAMSVIYACVQKLVKDRTPAETDEVDEIPEIPVHKVAVRRCGRDSGKHK